MDTRYLQPALRDFIECPDAANAYALAVRYMELGLSSAAINYFMVAVEGTGDSDMRYKSLLGMGYLFLDQGDRLNEALLMAEYAKAERPTDKRSYALECAAYAEQARATDRKAQPGLWLEAWLKVLNGARTAANLPTEPNQRYDGRFTTDSVFVLYECEALASIGCAGETEERLNRLIRESADDPQTWLPAMRLLYRNGLGIDILGCGLM